MVNATTNAAVNYPFPPSQLLDGVSEVLEKFTFQESVNIGSVSLEDLSSLGKAAQRLIEAVLYFEQNVNLCLIEKYSSEGLETVKLLNTVLVPRSKEIPNTIDLSESFKSVWNVGVDWSKDKDDDA